MTNIVVIIFNYLVFHENLTNIFSSFVSVKNVSVVEGLRSVVTKNCRLECGIMFGRTVMYA
jgi:hypothetical protein